MEKIREKLSDDFLVALLSVYSDMDLDTEQLMFRVDKDDNVRVNIMCSDTFGYACADAEPINADNLPLFIEVIRDLQKNSKPNEFAECDAEIVFIALVRGRLPIPPRMNQLSESSATYLKQRLALE